MARVTSKGKAVQILKKELPGLRDKFGVEKIALYGSFAKGVQTKKAMSTFLSSLRGRWV